MDILMEALNTTTIAGNSTPPPAPLLDFALSPLLVGLGSILFMLLMALLAARQKRNEQNARRTYSPIVDSTGTEVRPRLSCDE